MPYRPCPNCAAHTPRLLEATSTEAYVWYLRCGTCGHVWTVSREDGTIVHHVTPIPPKDAPPKS